jgi:hypothetical protein
MGNFKRTSVHEEMLDTTGMQQQHKELRSKRAIMSGEQDNTSQDLQVDRRARDHEMNCCVTCQDLKNECQNIVEELATAEMKEETVHSLRARDIEMPATVRSFVCTDQERRNGGTPVGHSGQIALKREQSSIVSHF